MIGNYLSIKERINTRNYIIEVVVEKVMFLSNKNKELGLVFSFLTIG